MILCVMEFVIGSSQLVNQIPDDERNFNNNIIIMYPFAVGYPSNPSEYGYSNAGIVPYNVICNGTESRVEDCVRFPASSPFCQDPSTSAAGVVCISTGTS